MDGVCHCGAVRVSVPTPPRRVTSCNCSICRRLGTLWAYYPADQVRVDPADATDAYVWGEGNIAFHRCKVCGCAIRWTAVDPAGKRTGVNVRLMDDLDWASLTLVRLDGADSWKEVVEPADPRRRPFKYFL